MKYDLRAMGKGRKRGRVLVPIIDRSPGLEKAYLAELRKLEQEAARLLRELVLPRYEAKLTTDADEETFAAFRRLLEAFAVGTTARVRNLQKLEGRRHTKAWMAAARKAFGVDLAGIVKEEDLEDYLEAAGLRAAGLIRGLTDDLIRRVQSEVTSGLIAGQSAAKLRPILQETLGVSDARARLIARDQTAKVASDLNRRRHEDAGIEDYIWRTSQDERVRSRHRELDGKQYKYGEPTGAEEGLPPGQPIQCRCIAQAVVVF